MGKGREGMTKGGERRKGKRGKEARKGGDREI